MQTFTEIIREAREESTTLDVEVCGGARPQAPSQEAQLGSERAFRVEYYRSQTVFQGGEHDSCHQPPEGGFDYDVDEPQQHKYEIAFCSLMCKVGIMDEGDFE